MKIKDNVITAEHGNWLTDGVSYAKTVVLGAASNPAMWSEITDEEYHTVTLAEKI